MKIYTLSLAFLLTSINLISQSAEETPDDRALMEKAIQIEASSSNAATERQSYIDNIDTQIITLIGDIQFLSQQLDLTNIYNRQLQELIDSQEAEIISINEQMAELDKTNRGILPKLEEMVNTLSSIVENDTPFLLTERMLRIEELKDILVQSNISTSEKFRRVFEAYQIENEYGRTIESYRDEITFDSETYNVEVFRLGRVGLYARTSDGRNTAMYSKKEGKWIRKKGIDSELIVALKIAKKELPPSLLKLPVERI
tara:strand:- start:1870 stop:2640 length:771 start_codon:yes stop_codon:yes gene_type:complete